MYCFFCLFVFIYVKMFIPLWLSQRCSLAPMCEKLTQWETGNFSLNHKNTSLWTLAESGTALRCRSGVGSTIPLKGGVLLLLESEVVSAARRCRVQSRNASISLSAVFVCTPRLTKWISSRVICKRVGLHCCTQDGHWPLIPPSQCDYRHSGEMSVYCRS